MNKHLWSSDTSWGCVPAAVTAPAAAAVAAAAANSSSTPERRPPSKRTLTTTTTQPKTRKLKLIKSAKLAKLTSRSAHPRTATLAATTLTTLIHLTILLLLLLLAPGPGGALDPGIDLLDGLSLNTNLSQYQGVTVTDEYQHQRVYHLSGGDRNLVLPTSVFHRAVDQMKRTAEFTFAVVLKQEQANSGTIVSFSNGNNRYLELQSSGRRDEIRFHYTHITAAGEPLMHYESFPYRLADDAEHKVALTVSGTEVQLYIDCHPLYKRVMHFLPDRNFSASNMQLFVGQRNSNSHYLFKGDLKDLRIITGPYGYLSQCELMDAQCPTCGQFLEYEKTLAKFQQSLLSLQDQLVAAESRITYLEKCDCKKSCLIDGTSKDDGDIWDIGCSQCKCESGVVTCGPRPCPEVKCKHPVLEEGECCPKCLKNCYINKKDYEHGDKQILGCRNCSCIDGNMMCDMLQCPELKCPLEQQMSVTDECCKFCQGVDYCSKGHACHTNATCLNLNTKYTCTCRSGFHGDGYECSDIDECAQQGGLNGNHCHLNTRCVNTFGSYVCECVAGYRRLDKFNCVEVDECKSGEHSCHEHADCINTAGSYHCRCQPGYEGDGYDCKPVCNQTCLNGGECRAPGVCTCRAGYVGESCEKDLDECATGVHRCKETTNCVNMPGWYYCKCKPGFETKGKDCVDIDECYLNTHSCHPTARCVNTQGHFECVCPEAAAAIEDASSSSSSGSRSVAAVTGRPGAASNCRLSCMFEDSEIPDGGQISPRNQPCKVCTCSRGVISCVEPPCNCSRWQERGSGARDLCCPQCDPKESCQHQELKHVTFRSGEQWIYQCQTCECLYGEFDCWRLECPPLTCDNPLPMGRGDCCPRCPDDMCGLENATALAGPNGGSGASLQPCLYEQHIYASGQTFKYPSRECATCSCKDGKITCRYDDHCVADELRQLEESPADDSVKSSLSNHKPSQTTTPKTSGSSRSASAASTIPPPTTTATTAAAAAEQSTSSTSSTATTAAAAAIPKPSRSPSNNNNNAAKKLLKRSLPNMYETPSSFWSSPVVPLRRYGAGN